MHNGYNKNSGYKNKKGRLVEKFPKYTFLKRYSHEC